MPEWWRERVIYQIYPRSFKDSNGDGVGDLVGITQKLDYLKDLGIGAIWISPFFKSPQADCGYDVSDYRVVDPMFGSDQDFETLLARAHELDIKVIIDLVLNHTSCEHPWFQEARKSKDNPKHDWYIWHDGQKPPQKCTCGEELNNKNDQAWHYNEETNECYLGIFRKEQPEVNWANRELQIEMFNIMKFWLDKSVDGFRLEIMHHHNYVYEEDHILQQKYDKNQLDVLKICKEMRQLIDSYPGERVLLGEVFEENPEITAQFQGNNDRLHVAFNFNFMYSSCNMQAYKNSAQAHYKILEQLSPEGFNQPNFTLGNHDQPRHASRFKESNEEEQVKKMKVLAAMLLTLKGTPTLYYGEEIGMQNVDIPKHQRVDPLAFSFFPVNQYYRDKQRTPMQWTASGGFSTVNSWLPMGDLSINVQDQLQNTNSLLQFYKKLIMIRNNSILKSAPISFNQQNEDVLHFERAENGQKITVLLNFGKNYKIFGLNGTVLVADNVVKGKNFVELLKYGILIVKQ
ncbi:Alpha-glucosidase [Hexamita inflata]|uniref:Alpha-glucosidase n=1 Tax=Hexamita inflata TaxID=28002 RepID=A0AA86QBG4_9EUKA|nr:Alpha-glucosidase [Hexamita inflata]